MTGACRRRRRRPPGRAGAARRASRCGGRRHCGRATAPCAFRWRAGRSWRPSGSTDRRGDRRPGDRQDRRLRAPARGPAPHGRADRRGAPELSGGWRHPRLVRAARLSGGRPARRCWRRLRSREAGRAASRPSPAAPRRRRPARRAAGRPARAASCSASARALLDLGALAAGAGGLLLGERLLLLRPGAAHLGLLQVLARLLPLARLRHAANAWTWPARARRAAPRRRRRSAR